MEKLEIFRDPIAEKLDEMADLCEYWKKNRGLGRMPNAIRAALLMIAEECRILRDQEEAAFSVK